MKIRSGHGILIYSAGQGLISSQTGVAPDKGTFSDSAPKIMLWRASTKTYVVGSHWKGLAEALLMSTYNMFSIAKYYVSNPSYLEFKM